MTCEPEKAPLMALRALWNSYPPVTVRFSYRTQLGIFSSFNRRAQKLLSLSSTLRNIGADVEIGFSS